MAHIKVLKKRDPVGLMLIECSFKVIQPINVLKIIADFELSGNNQK